MPQCNRKCELLEVKGQRVRGKGQLRPDNNVTARVLSNGKNFDNQSLLGLSSSGWLRSKEETKITGGNDFQNALDDALNYQNIETDPQRILKLKPYIKKYNWERIEFPAGPKE